MIKKDMHHLLVDAMRKEDPVRMYQEIQDHFKGCKLHHVEAAINLKAMMNWTGSQFNGDKTK